VCAVRARPEDGQLSLVGVVIALIVLGALTGIGLVVFVGDSGSDHGGSQGVQGPGVSQADNAAAQQSLSQAQTAASTVGVANGYGSITASTLAGVDPSITFTPGPSTSSSVVSVAPASPGLGLGGGGEGSVTLAAHARTGTCWYLFLGPGGPVYGSTAGQSSCQAVAIPSAPIPGSGGGANWSPASWPPA
jgi:hypothetical protein